MNVELVSVAKTLLINENNEVLILTIGEYPAHPEKSFTPDLPGGLVDPGETELIAAHRETQEEAGISLDESRFALAYAKTKFYPEEHKSVTKFLYIARVDSTPEVTISWEHASHEWVPIEKLKEIEFRSFYREAIDYCFESGLL